MADGLYRKYLATEGIQMILWAKFVWPLPSNPSCDKSARNGGGRLATIG
jgi:hypothetical protein